MNVLATDRSARRVSATSIVLRLAPLFVLAACTADEEARVVGELVSDRVELVAESSEPIVAIPVAEGTVVEAGEVLVRQDGRRARARLDQAEAAASQARARLAELLRGPRSELIDAARANLEAAEADLEFRTVDFRRVERVASQKLLPPDALDRARMALESARAAVDLRRAELEAHLNGTTVEELAQAEAAVAEAEARRDAAAIDLERLTIVAPVAGMADTRLLEVGERPDPGQAVMVLLAGDQPHARVYIPERLRATIRPGSDATIYLDGWPEPLSGRVRWVASEAAFTPYFALTERDRGRLSYVAKIDIVDHVDRLPDGVPLEVRFGDGTGP